ncbi:MAG TPA: hypothetical protein DEB70_02755 [Planctomycetaceae bacterium]|nr:hypothetical protein [Planctomycetaceae bacterium]
MVEKVGSKTTFLIRNAVLIDQAADVRKLGAVHLVDLGVQEPSSTRPQRMFQVDPKVSVLKTSFYLTLFSIAMDLPLFMTSDDQPTATSTPSRLLLTKTN